MMNIFKKWFLKQDTKSSQDNEKQAVAYIFLGKDIDGEIFVKINFLPGKEEEVEDLLSMFVSGVLVESAFEVLSKVCKDEEQFLQIINNTHTKMVDFLQEKQDNTQQNDSPVVDPCRVFNPGDNNDFKG